MPRGKTTTTTTTTTTKVIKGGASDFEPNDYKRKGLSKEDIQEMKNAFDLFDTDGSGTIDTDELKQAFVGVGVDAKDQVLRNFLNDIDKDGNGTIEFPEFIEMMTASMKGGDTRDDLTKVFYFFIGDDQSDKIEVKHLRRVVDEYGEDYTDDQLQEMVDKADLDHDGKINFEEFYTIITKDVKNEE